MNLLTDPWIPARAVGGSGVFRLLTYQALLCEANQNWRISLPRDDLELACHQLLVCLTQVIFLPTDDEAWDAHIKTPLTEHEFQAGVEFYRDWFDLDHPTQPFMQSRGVKAAEDTPIQKLLIGLPEGNNHAFFNEPGEVQHLSAPLAAIALFNQASNCPSFGGGFKGSLRGSAPITTLVWGATLRETIWRNVLTRANVERCGITIPAREADLPTWVEPIVESSTIHAYTIGLLRGLFWQPARVELVKAPQSAPCGVLAGEAVAGYSGFRKEKFNFKVEGVWPHPHGILHMSWKNGVKEERFASFTTTAPAWTQLAEFVVKAENDKKGSTPAGPVTQAMDRGEGDLKLLVGGYRTNQANVEERRHELISLAAGWQDDKGFLPKLVTIGKEAKEILWRQLNQAVKGQKEKGMKGIGVDIHETGEKLFYARTESLIYETFSNALTFRERKAARLRFAEEIAQHCRDIFKTVTDPYFTKPELIPIIASTRRSLEGKLKKLKEEA